MPVFNRLFVLWHRIVHRGEAKFDKAVNCRNLAVVIVDMQPHFVSRLEYGEGVRIMFNQVKVLLRCQEEDIPVVVLEFAGCGRTLDSLRGEVEKTPRRRYLGKIADSGFTNPELETHLRALGIKKIFIMGLNGCACVWATAAAALSRGFRVYTSPDVISSEGCDEQMGYPYLRWFRRNTICVRI